MLKLRTVLNRLCFWNQLGTGSATHALVQFHEDDSFGVVPLTKFVSPSLEDVHQNSECTVRWEGKRSYQREAIFLGKRL